MMKSGQKKAVEEEEPTFGDFESGLLPTFLVCRCAPSTRRASRRKENLYSHILSTTAMEAENTSLSRKISTLRVLMVAIGWDKGIQVDD